MILCSFRNLNLSFSSKVIFKNAELVIKKGEKIGLLGLNGKGKSSLFKILEEKISPDKGKSTFTFDKSEGFDIFHVPQDMPSTIPLDTKIENIFWFFYKDWKEIWEEKKHELPEEAWGLQQSFLSYCKSFGINHFEQELGSLSGGQQKKVLLSLGLSCDKELILWDEPTNHLDIDSIRRFEDELQSSSKTFVLTTHDRYLLGKTTNKIFQIDNYKIITFQGGYTQFLELQAQKENERVQLLNRLQNSYRREDAWMKQGIKARGTRSKKRVENYESVKNDIRKLKEQAKKELTLNIEKTNRKNKKLVEAKDINFSYKADQNLLEEISFSIYRKDKIGIIGPNGVGKSTLLKIISGDISNFEGILKKSPELTIRFFSQMRTDLPLESSPFELLGDGTDQVSLGENKTMHVVSYFKKFLFHEDEIHRPIKTFSGGERNRLQLALNLKLPADIWIFDEPTNDLDLETLLILEKTLSDFKGPIIVISHDRAFLKNCTNRLFLLSHNGIEVFEGGYEQAEAYLEALALEKSLDEENVGEKKLNSKQNQKSKVLKDTKTTNPQEIKNLEDRISETEKLIEKIDQIMNQLGGLQSSDETVLKLSQLSEKKEKEEENLLNLYELLETKNIIKNKH